MARPSSALVEWSQYLALRCFASLLHCFGIDQNLTTAGAVGDAFYRLSARHRRRAERNIALSFPSWPVAQVRETARRSMQHMFQMFMVDAIVTPRLFSQTAWPDHLHFEHIEPIADRLVRNQASIFVTGHCGNWEALGSAIAAMGFPMYALARPLDNRLINDWLMNVREALGLRVLTKWGATPVLQEILRNGGRLGFIADQNAGDQGVFVPFFGRLASSYKSIALLAMRYRVPIQVGAAIRMGGRFDYMLVPADFIVPHEWEAQADPVFYITARYNHAIERLIRVAPEQYLWVHRRWRSRPRFERLGRPMPARLLAKLKALPWMTPSELDLLVERSNPRGDAVMESDEALQPDGIVEAAEIA